MAWWKSPLVLAIAVGVIAAGAVAWLLFAPDPVTHRDDALADVADFSSGASAGAAEPEPIATGAWQGSDEFHHASGTVGLYEDASGWFLFFEDFDARSGPDVYLYASPHAGADDLADATKVRVQGGAADGRATVRGDFRVDLPAGLDASNVASLVLWCDAYSVHFGTADLS